MKTQFTLMFAIVATAINVYSQTIFIPSGSAGIGTSTTTGVGVGVSNPDNALQVAGDIKMASRFHFGTANAYGGSYGIIGMMTGIPGKSFAFYNYDGPVNELMTLNGSTGAVAINNGGLTVGGNVGLGISAPISRLSVAIPIATSNTPADPAAYGSYFTDNSSATFAIRSLGNGTIHLATDGASRKIILGGGVFEQTLFVNAGGNVGIGTANTGSFKLAVEGKIAAREVNVTLATPWPDYVFEKDYKFPSLEEVKLYIEENKHLPEVPSAKEMETNGINVGEMNMILLKKVEELTLYLIEANRKLAEIDSLKKELSEIKKQL